MQIKISTVLVILILIGATVLETRRISNAGPMPQLLSPASVGTAAYDFGKVNQGSAAPLMHKFFLTNDNPAPVVVERAGEAGIVTPCRYVGAFGYFYDGAGRYYVRARYLDPDRGRWISNDPKGFEGGDWNLYGYTHNQPVTALDPSGLECSGCTTSHNYDGCGRLVSSTTTGSLTKFNWDAASRLIETVLPDGSIEKNRYNAIGIRTAKIVGESTHYYVIDGKNVIAELNETGAAVSSWTHASGRWGKLIAEHRGAYTRVFSFDPSSNSRLLTDKVGNVAATFFADAFGVDRGTEGEASLTPHRFGGEYGYWSDSEERVYVRARHYNAASGRWVSRDPIGFQGRDWNIYRYVGNSPGMGIDPLGLANSNTNVINQMVSCVIDDWKEILKGKCLPVGYTVNGYPIPIPDKKDSIPMAACKAMTSYLTMWCKDSPFDFAEKFGLKVEFPTSLSAGGIKAELSLGICDCMVNTICNMQLNVRSIFSSCYGGCKNDPNDPGKCCNDCCDTIANNFSSYSAGFRACNAGCGTLGGE